MSELQPHIMLGEEHSAKYTILPGDHKRVDLVSTFLDGIHIVAFNREYKTVIGYYKGIKVIATSTGIGGPSAAIAIEELKSIGVETFIRIGSCGALQENVKLGELIISTGSVRDDGTSLTYIDKQYPAVPDFDVTNALIQSCKDLGVKFHHGITRSHDSYYIDNNSEITNYWSSKGILGEDLETSTLFVVGRLRGLKTGSILNNVVEHEDDLKEGINEYVNKNEICMEGEKNEILVALEAIVLLENEKVQ